MMVNLEGSTKQVAWATDIRDSVLRSIEQKRAELIAQIAKIESRPADHPYAPQHPAIAEGLLQYKQTVSDLDEARELLENEASAKWWIEHRGSTILAVTSALRRDLAMAI